MLFEYLMLAMITSGGLAGGDVLSRNHPPRTLGSDAIVQPSGGVVVGLPQCGEKRGKVNLTQKHTRHHKRRHKGKGYQTPKKEGS